MAKKKKKRISDDDMMVMAHRNDWLPKEAEWYKELIESKKMFVDYTNLDKVEKECNERNEGNGFFRLKDVCNVLDLQFPADKTERNRIATFSNNLQISLGFDGAHVLWNAMMTILKNGENIKDPTDMFLSKKEARKSRKRKKIEAVHGPREIKIPLSEEQKKAARKERVRVRKEAAKLGISTEEFKKLEAEPLKKTRKKRAKKAVA